MVYVLLAGNDADAAYTPAAITALSIGGEEAMTPLCLDLDKLQLSAVSSWPAAFTPASGDNGSANSEPSDAFSLPSKVAPAGATPAMRGSSTGWNRSIFETPGVQEQGHLHNALLCCWQPRNETSFRQCTW